MSPSTSFVRRVLAVASVAALAATLISGNALALTSTKPYHVDIGPDDVAAGSHVPYTVTIYNDSNQPALGSANWTIPSAFSDITILAVPSGATWELAGNLLKLRNLAIAAGTSKQFSYDATAPCVSGIYSASVSAKQSNDYKGPPGNDFVLDVTPPDPVSDLDVTVTGSCRLAFGFGSQASPFPTQPASCTGTDLIDQPNCTQIDTNITSGAYDPSGPSIRVAILDADGNLATWVDTTVTLGIAVNPGGGSLSGDKTQDTVPLTGIATFERDPGSADALSIDKSGLGYRLGASSDTPGIASGTSDEFNVVDVGMVCPTGPCSSGKVNGKDNLTATYSLDAEAIAGDLLTVGVSIEAITCTGYTPHTDTITTNFTGSGTKVLTMTFTNTGNEPKPSFVVCYNDSLDPGVTEGEILPSCKDTGDVPPCVISVDNDKKKIIIMVLLPEGDPKTWG